MSWWMSITNFIFLAPRMPSSSSLAWSSSPYKFYTKPGHRQRTYDQVLVSSNKWLVAQLKLQVDSQGFDPVPHTVRGCHAGQVLQKVRQRPLVWRFFAQVLIVAHIALRLDLRQLFA